MTFDRKAAMDVVIGAVIAAAILLVAYAALAQPANYTITLTGPQLDQIGKLLAKQPYEDVYQLIAVIQAQVVQQQHPPAPPAPPEQTK